MLSGQEFYKYFFGQFQEYVKNNQKRYDNHVEKEAAWTEFVKDDFLSELARKLSFGVTRREGVYGIDLTWERTSDHMCVAIEHENNHKTIWRNEVPNLMRAAAPLKVLITYVTDTDFPARKMADKLLTVLKDSNFAKRTYQEFLLIIGTYSMEKPTDWIGYLYKPETSCRSLVFCSNMLEAESSPARKAWKKRREETKVRSHL